MTLASGADVQIGSYAFMIDDAADEPYAHCFESLYSDQGSVLGVEGVQTANPSVLVWNLDDFAGGGEVKYFDERTADSYWYGKNNPRIRGAISSPPTRTDQNITLTNATEDELYFTQVGGKAWAGSGRELLYSSDGITWAKHNAAALFGAGYKINGMTNDGNLPWVSASDGTTRKTLQITSTTASTTAVSDVTTAIRTYGMAMLEGSIFMWTGGALYKYDSQGSLPITHVDATHKGHQPFASTPSGTFYSGIVAGDTSVFYFTAGGGSSHVFEYKYNSATNSFIGRPVWNPPNGFTCRQMTYAMGVLYLLGDLGDQVVLFGMSTVNREPLFLSYVGQHYSSEAAATLTPRALAPSYGAQVILTVDDATTNFTFVYDAESDSMSELDESPIANVGRYKAMATFGSKRLGASGIASTNLSMSRWIQDFNTPAGSWTYVSSAYHMKYPVDEKLLFGFEVVADPSITAGTVQVEYQIDESGSWVSAGTTTAGVKYTKLDVSSTNAKFRIIRLRLTGASGARLFSLSTRAYVNSYQEVWRLALKLNQEGANRETRPSSRQVSANTLANYLNTLATTKSTVTFLDGRRYDAKGGNNIGYTTHTCVVEFPRSGGTRMSRRNGKNQGTAQIVLRSVS